MAINTPYRPTDNSPPDDGIDRKRNPSPPLKSFLFHPLSHHYLQILSPQKILIPHAVSLIPAELLLAPHQPAPASKAPRQNHNNKIPFPTLQSFFSPYISEENSFTFRTPISIQQMNLERDTPSNFLRIGLLMRTATNHEKLHRNYRSQTRSDAERRRGAP